MKDQDSFARTQYLLIYIKMLPVFLLIGIVSIFTYGWWAFLIVMLASLLVPFPAMYATGRVADAFVFLYSGGSRTHTLQEQLVGEVEKIRELKRKNKLEKALEQADFVLIRDPEHPEALFLKAQILFELDVQYGAANACLNTLLTMDPPPDDKILHWAIALRKKIMVKVQERAHRNT
ncbi:MAG: hypothetical protein D3911_09905 [Candidatus Electrothrix sp. AW3_4]|nr:hypothetical protein [Candidatus Electrothrix gigas]